MKVVAGCIVLLWAGVGLAGPVASGDYNVAVHVAGSRSMPCSANGTLALECTQRLDAVIGGKKLELEGVSQGVLALGDYKARLTEKHRNSYDVYQTYTFLMPDGKLRDYNVVGIAE